MTRGIFSSGLQSARASCASRKKCRDLDPERGPFIFEILPQFCQHSAHSSIVWGKMPALGVSSANMGVFLFWQSDSNGPWARGRGCEDI